MDDNLFDIHLKHIVPNIIFDEDDDEERDYEGEEHGAHNQTRGGADQTTVITWPPTLPDETKDNVTASSLLDVSKSHRHTMFETQETQETQSYNYSDASSIARFPTFHFTLHSLTSLSELSKLGNKGSRKVNVLLAALEVEGPDTIRIKKGADAGKEISILKMILGDEAGNVCKLTAWREFAEMWGGAGTAIGAKRGDILLIENINASWEAGTTPSLSASSYLKTKLEICYRTMPYTHEDNRLRPDLRLGESDASIRKVAAIVRWFETMAGLPGPKFI